MRTVNTLTRLEGLLEGVVERSFARLFRSRLQPVEIAKRLTREMEAGRIVGVSSIMVPNHYKVALGPDDYTTFAPIRASLEQEMVQYLLSYAIEHGYTTVMAPEVELMEAPTLRPGRMIVVGQLTEPPPGAMPPTEPLDQTRLMTQAIVDPPQPSYIIATGEAHLSLGETTYPLAGDDVALGRGLENTIVLEDRRVSRSHARLISSGGHWVVRDESSTNGTFVNGRMVSQHALKNGDCLSLGGLELVFHQR